MNSHIIAIEAKYTRHASVKSKRQCHLGIDNDYSEMLEMALENPRNILESSTPLPQAEP
jgi:hypothetical protein